MVKIFTFPTVLNRLPVTIANSPISLVIPTFSWRLLGTPGTREAPRWHLGLLRGGSARGQLEMLRLDVGLGGESHQLCWFIN